MSAGTFTATVAARSAIALFTGAIGTGTGSGGGGSGGTASVAFSEYATTTYGDVNIYFGFVSGARILKQYLSQNIFVTGSLAELGSWAPASAVSM